MGPIPRAHFNLPDDPDTSATAAVPRQETNSRETTQSVAERARVGPAETEARRVPTGSKNKNSSLSSSDGTTDTTFETTTTSPARALLERVGNEAGEDSQPAQKRQIAEPTAECEDTTTSDALLKHVENTWRNSQKSKMQSSESRQVVDSVHDDEERKAKWTTRGYEQTLDGNEDFFSATPAMLHLKMMLIDAAERTCRGHRELQRSL